ncbi:Na+/H+ antiporter subunit D [Nocardioides plantarum]|uniref:Na+/H+ antiporter subunit D n=2 Tax=Nocardioides plantarum TaxID=29299 RepID=A0ABV5KCJ6_9ACTN|nr:Na+/H+ antiporter subunit D [Nocardioides plantarum]
MMTSLVPLPVLLPLLGSGAALMLFRFPRAQRLVSVVVLALVVLVSATLLVVVDREGTQVVWLGGWTEIGVALVADRLAVLMLLVSSIVTLAVMLYSLGQGISDSNRSAPVSIYHPTFLTLVAGVSNAFLAGDLFNLFVSFEILLFASYVLLTLGGTAGRIRAGTIYVVVNALSSMLFLITIAAVYAAVGTLNLAQIAVRLDDLPDSTSLMLHLLLLVTFAIKAAVFPLSLWLPDSYPTAPAPVTAVFAGLLTKVGVYAIIRTETLLFPGGRLSELLMVVALLSMLIGILGAIAQSDMKRLLSFTLVSHIGYMIFGIGLSSQAGMAGAIFYVAHHITIQTALFLVVGLIERQAGSTSLLRLGGLARLFPVLGVLFFVAGMNLAGIPPLSGFLGKVGLLEAGIADGGALAWTLVVGGTVTSLLTLYAVAKTWALAFWRSPQEAHAMAEELAAADASHGPAAPDAPAVGRRGQVRLDTTSYDAGLVRQAGAIVDSDRPDRDLHQRLEDDGMPTRLPALMTWTTAVLVAISVAITVVAGPLYAFTERAAGDVIDRSTYVTAVAEAAE